jgi:hypothetical protein
MKWRSPSLFGECRFLALSDMLHRRTIPVANGAKRTSIKPRYQKFYTGRKAWRPSNIFGLRPDALARETSNSEVRRAVEAESARGDG